MLAVVNLSMVKFEKARAAARRRRIMRGIDALFCAVLFLFACGLFFVIGRCALAEVW
jgi:hypothetical protein